MRLLRYISFALITSLLPASAQLTVPCGTVLNFNVTVDGSDVLRFPTGANFFGSNFGPYVDGLCIVTMASGDIIYFHDATNCLAPSKGNVSDLLGAACVVTGSGTPETYAIFDCAGNAIKDGILRELTGDLLFDDGANNIITLDYTSLPAGAICLQFGNVSGVIAIDNGIDSQELVFGTATAGELVGSGLTWTGIILGTQAACSQLDIHCMSDFVGVDTGIKYSLLGGGGRGHQWFIDCNTLLRATAGNLNIGSIGDTTDVDINHSQGSVSGGNMVAIKTDLLTGDRIQNYPDEDGNYVVSSESVPVNLTADDQVMTMTAGIMLFESNTTGASNRTFTLDISTMAEDMRYTLRFIETSTGEAELLNIGVYFLAADFRPDIHDTITLYTDGTSVYEISRSPNRNP